MIKINGFWVPENDVHLKDWQEGKSFTQNKCLDRLIKHCQKEDIKFKKIIDVGAWVGTWTMSMLDYCEQAVAIEPDPMHYECLVKNLPSDVQTHQCAIGNESKFVSLSDDNFTQARRVMGEGKIPMVTIDSLNIKEVDLIKIDVEGYEMEVLRGAVDTLENADYLMIELNNNSKKYGSSNLEIEKYLAKLGFKPMIKLWPDVVWRKKG